MREATERGVTPEERLAKALIRTDARAALTSKPEPTTEEGP